MPPPRARESGAHAAATAASLIEAASDLVSERGIAALSLRSLAEASSLSSATALYHFGTKATLWRGVGEALERRIACWQDEQVRSFAEAPPSPPLAAGIAAALATALLRDIGGTIIAFLELSHLARRERIDLSDAQQRFFRHEDAFHSRLFVDKGLPPTASAPLWRAIRGLAPILLLDEPGPRRDALVHLLAARLVDRLTGRKPVLAPVPVPIAEPARADRTKGKQQLVEAAIRTIGVHGVDGLTHRRIAAEAGVSLALTTYHYKTKLDIVLDALLEVQQRGVTLLVNEDLSPDQFLPAIILDDSGEQRPALSALTSLNLASIRSPALRDLARRLRDSRGVDALRWLRARGIADADLFDGIIWSAAGTPLVERALTLPAPDRRAYLEAASAELYASLFRGDAIGR